MLGTDDSRMVAMTGDGPWETAARLGVPATLWLQSLGQNSLERKQTRGPDAGSQGGCSEGWEEIRLRRVSRKLVRKNLSLCFTRGLIF